MVWKVLLPMPSEFKQLEQQNNRLKGTLLRYTVEQGIAEVYCILLKELLRFTEGNEWHCLGGSVEHLDKYMNS